MPCSNTYVGGPKRTCNVRSTKTTTCKIFMILNVEAISRELLVYEFKHYCKPNLKRYNLIWKLGFGPYKIKTRDFIISIVENNAYLSLLAFLIIQWSYKFSNIKLAHSLHVTAGFNIFFYVFGIRYSTKMLTWQRFKTKNVKTS